MSDINTAELISVLTKIQHNYTSLAQYWYDIFYNPEPKVVSVDYYDSNGDKVVISIDNLAKIKDNIGGISGEGAPSMTSGVDFGTIYHDTDSGDLYRYARDYGSPDVNAGVWDKIITSDILDSIIIRNNDPIINHPQVLDGTLYLSKDTDKLYIGRNGVWERIDASPSLVNHFRKVVSTGDMSLVTNGIILDAACENKNTMSVYVDGVYLNPEKYEIINNGFVVRFKEPLISPEENDIEIDIQYFTNLSLYEDYWEEEETELSDGTVVTHKKFKFTKDLFETLQSITSRLNDLLSRTTAMENTVDSIGEDIIRLQQELRDAVAITVGDITQEVRAISDSVKSEKSAVLQMHNAVKNWYDQVSIIKSVVESMESDLSEDIQWLREVFTDPETGEIDLHKFVFTDEFLQAMSDQQADYTTKINDIRVALLEKVNACDGRMTTIEAAQALEGDKIAENTTAIEQLEQGMETLEENLRNDFFSESNFPIDFFSTIKNNKYLYNPVVETDGKYAIEVELKRDVSYYTIDLTDDLTTFGNDKIYKYFTLTNKINKDEVERTDANSHTLSPTTGTLEDLHLEGLTLNQEISDGDLTIKSIMYTENVDYEREDKTYYPVDTKFNIPGYDAFSFIVTEVASEPSEPSEEDSYMVQARVTIKNDSLFRPRIIWVNSNISWFGGEEPDFEAGKTYLLEFISYDYGEHWYAHTLGICQPSINTSDIIRTFDIILTDYDAATELGMLCDIYYNKEDGKTYYAGEYRVDNGGIIKDVTLTFDKRELGDALLSFRVHKPNDAMFDNHSVLNYTPIIDDEIPKETVFIDNNEVNTDVHYYKIMLVSDSYSEEIATDYAVDITLAREVDGVEGTIVLPTINNMRVTDDTIEVIIASGSKTQDPEEPEEPEELEEGAREPDVIAAAAFAGTDLKTATTPWKVKTINVLGGVYTLENKVEKALELDDMISVYLDPEESTSEPEEPEEPEEP